MIPVTYGYARSSKADDATRNLETQLHVPQDFEVWEDHIFEGAMLGSSISRFAWSDLIARTRPNYTVDVAWLDRFSRNFDEDVRIQAEITKQNIGVAAIRGGINTADDSAAVKLFRRMSWPRGPTGGVHQRAIKAGLDRTRAERRKPGRPPALTPEQAEECWRMYAETHSIRQVARIMKVSQGTVKRLSCLTRYTQYIRWREIGPLQTYDASEKQSEHGKGQHRSRRPAWGTVRGPGSYGEHRPDFHGGTP